jgi:hypothetical protein
MERIHVQVLQAARRIAGPDWTFSVADLIHSLPHLNPATVRTHVASRCCVNAPSHHASRYPYFRSMARGSYRIEPAFRRSRLCRTRPSGWQDQLMAVLPRSVDPTLLAESLGMAPTERLETMRRAAESLEAMTRR